MLRLHNSFSLAMTAVVVGVSAEAPPPPLPATTETDHATSSPAVPKNAIVVNGGNNNPSTNHNGVATIPESSNHQVHFRKILPGEPTTRKVLSKRPKASSQPPIAEELQVNFE